MTPREFAIEVTKRLQDAGHTALWAGGCVRDALIGREPKDYDVATSALPDQVRKLFGENRTLAIGASFGVITVLGRRSAGSIEVATFRRDGGYSDGRHPDSVEFTDAREDAIRRDFTINGMFFDPLRDEVIDYVGGQEDLAGKVIRAIGDANQRFEEDKLRMLRAVRFATTFGFKIEFETMQAMREKAAEIVAVSEERIGVELRKTLTHPNRAMGVRLLLDSGLLNHVVPHGSELARSDHNWFGMLTTLERLGEADFETAAAVFLAPILGGYGTEEIFSAWKLSNQERSSLNWITVNKATLAQADKLAWSNLQPVLVREDASRALEILEAEHGSGFQPVTYCRERLAWSQEKLDPPPLLTGDDLIKAGMKPGKAFARILAEIRAAQLDGDVFTFSEALGFARKLSEGA